MNMTHENCVCDLDFKKYTNAIIFLVVVVFSLVKWPKPSRITRKFSKSSQRIQRPHSISAMLIKSKLTFRRFYFLFIWLIFLSLSLSLSLSISFYISLYLYLFLFPSFSLFYLSLSLSLSVSLVMHISFHVHV